MDTSRRSRSVMALAVSCSIAVLMGSARSVQAQQIPTDPIIYQTGDDSNTATLCGLNESGVWGGATSPTTTTAAAYVDEKYRIRTPTGANVTFAADSFTLLSFAPAAFLASTTDSGTGLGSTNLGSDGSYAYLTLKGNLAANTTTFNNLVLANGGVLFNYGNDNQTIAGNIYLVPAATTLDGATTSVSGGIVDTHGNNLSGTTGPQDNYFNIASNISGAGMLRVENTGGGTSGATFITEVITLGGSNTFSGGVVLDGTSTVGTTGNGPDLAIDSPTALGTGTLTILPASYVGLTPSSGAPGVAIDNLAGAPETLTTNNAQTWLGGFTFNGTSSLDMGSGPITLGADVTLTTKASTLSLEGAISGGFGLTKSGAGTLLLNGISTYTGVTNVSGGTLGGTGTIPAALNVLSGAFLAPGLTALAPGTLTVGGPLTLGSGSTLDIELTGITSDEVIADGLVGLSGSTLTITLAPGYTPAVGTTFTIIDNESDFGTAGPFSNDSGGYLTDSEGDLFSVNYGAIEDGDGQANDVTVTFVAPVPEPTAVGLLSLSALGLLRRRRCR